MGRSQWSWVAAGMARFIKMIKLQEEMILLTMYRTERKKKVNQKVIIIQMSTSSS